MTQPPLISFPQHYEDLPGWSFDWDEISVHVYRVVANGPKGEVIVDECTESQLKETFERLRKRAMNG